MADFADIAPLLGVGFFVDYLGKELAGFDCWALRGGVWHRTGVPALEMFAALNRVRATSRSVFLAQGWDEEIQLNRKAHVAPRRLPYEP